ncbi:response regulator transcription factor [Cupriavidus sp. RAF12]|uniref:response regulator transcription factor n=1 Tax=Cupriavidus sp. RAF12 TaxID=3233050 RepID=UPI003F9251EF
MLSIAGFRCSLFRAGRDLIHGLGHDSYDMLLIDSELPDVSAIDIIRAVRSVRARDVPIVMLSSQNNDDDLVEALHAGADDYVVGPLPPGCCWRASPHCAGACRTHAFAAPCTSVPSPTN